MNEIVTTFIPARISHKKKARSKPKWDSLKVIIPGDGTPRLFEIHQWCIDKFGEYTEWGHISTVVWYDQNRWYWDSENWYFKNPHDMIKFKFYLTTI